MFGGIVVKGDGEAAKQGYPTANINVSREDVDLKTGVYAGYVFYRKEKYPAAIVIQDRPWKVEAHILEYHGDELYGVYLEVDVVQKVSEIELLEKEELIQKIKEDVELVKEVLHV